MFDFISRLREKPEHTRKTFTYVFSFGVTFVIFTVWVSTLYLRFNTPGPVEITQADISAQKKVTQNEASPLQSFKDSMASIGTAFDRLKSLFGKPGAVEYQSK